MVARVSKRDGRSVKYNPNKIVNAVISAMSTVSEVDYDIANLVADRVTEHFTEDKKVSVEEIQDRVEEELISLGLSKVAKEYILYRDMRAKTRDITRAANVSIIDEYIKREDWKIKENSNMTYSLQGLNHYVSSELSKTYWLNKIYPSDVRSAHLSGDMHIHDLNYLAPYCIGWDLYDLLIEGFKGCKSKIESKPAKHLRSALGQVVNFFYTLQGEAAGAQAFSNFDTLLAPFIKFDGLNHKQLKQALQEFLFNINVPTRVGFQAPFTNVTLDLVIPSYYKDQPVIIGGKPQDITYGECQEYVDMFNKALFEAFADGDASGRVFTFPIPTVNITKAFDWDNPNLEGLWDITMKYGIPYFSNFVNSDMNPEDVRSMCCRLRLSTKKLKTRGGGLFASNPLTGSIGVVTINLPRIGYNSSNEEEFLETLEHLMLVAKKSLEIKRECLEQLTDKELYPYAKFYLRGIKERFGEYWKNHFSTIGIVGMNEACINLFGKDITQCQDFTSKVMDFMRDKLLEFGKETGDNYNLEATPAESTAFRFAMLDKEVYFDILCANEDDFENGASPFYTNSTQLPVNYTDDVFEALELQDELQSKYTGGTVFHMFSGEKVSSSTVVKDLTNKICNNFKLPYFTFTPTFSVCPSHGYIQGEHFSCPKCGDDCEVYSRVVGYIRPINQWNDGKVAEYKQRKTFRV